VSVVPAQPAAPVAHHRTPARPARRRRWRSSSGTAGLLLLAGSMLTALAAPWLAPQNPLAQDLMSRLQPPGAHGPQAVYWLGTDGLGRDSLSRLFYGARASLAVAGTAVTASGTAGLFVGLAGGYYGTWVGALLMRFVDVVLSIPFLLLAIAVVAALGPSLVHTIVVLALTRWPRYARVAHAHTLAARNRDFVQAARALGGTDGRIMLRHVLPEVLPSAVVVATLEIGLMIVFEAALSFLGLGVQPPTPSWGSMLADGRAYVASAWWLATFPGLAIMVTVLGANLVGDAVRDRLDPRIR
jgi:peptide/nickel transport system permease protein